MQGSTRSIDSINVIRCDAVLTFVLTHIPHSKAAEILVRYLVSLWVGNVKRSLFSRLCRMATLAFPKHLVLCRRPRKLHLSIHIQQRRLKGTTVP